MERKPTSRDVRWPLLRQLCAPLLIFSFVTGMWLFTRLEVQDRPHSHDFGSHGGRVVAIGGGRHHAEIAFDKDGTVRLYLLGSDASRVMDVDQQQLTAHVMRHGDPAGYSITLQPEPQSGDRAGRTSQFVGQVPDQLAGEQLEVTIPKIRVDRQRFRLAFIPADSDHTAGMAGMPSKVSDEEERELYLVPGGKYTQADIEANGERTASEAFRGFRARHDFNPQPGDRLCPVTRTKANPDCSWIIAGRTYEFCCPPCVDEFVRLAKESPDEILEPEAYVQAAGQ